MRRAEGALPLRGVVVLAGVVAGLLLPGRPVIVQRLGTREDMGVLARAHYTATDPSGRVDQGETVLLRSFVPPADCVPPDPCTPLPMDWSGTAMSDFTGGQLPFMLTFTSQMGTSLTGFEEVAGIGVGADAASRPRHSQRHHRERDRWIAPSGSNRARRGRSHRGSRPGRCRRGAGRGRRVGGSRRLPDPRAMGFARPLGGEPRVAFPALHRVRHHERAQHAHRRRSPARRRPLDRATRRVR